MKLFKIFFKTAAGGSDFVSADTAFHQSNAVVTNLRAEIISK
jgi:hypothetical protein